MKTVFRSNRECVEAWLSRNYPVGYAHSKRGILSFEDNSLYSYSTEIAKIVEDNILITSENYSTTTGCHKGLIRWQVDQAIFEVPSLEPVHEVNIAYFLDGLRRLVLKFSHSGIGGRWILECNQRLHAKLLNYCEVFGLQKPITLGLYLDPDYNWIKKRFWGNVFIPKWLANKKMLEPKDILKTKNAEVRHELIKRIGIERICYSLNAKTIDRRGNYELLLLDLGDGRRRPYLKMLNPSVPECWHIEGVHPACKTVQDALNFRRYGMEALIRKTVESSWRSETIMNDNVEDWNPETLT